MVRNVTSMRTSIAMGVLDGLLPSIAQVVPAGPCAERPETLSIPAAIDRMRALEAIAADGT
ncbi:hypothetical protein THIOKS1140002 [Thiocapsa sp. KS1]|nr:hypothetical protein THIOKS1140002 [Thiocapsa sp. KS1]